MVLRTLIRVDMKTLRSMVDAQDSDDVVHLDAVTRVLTHEDFTPVCADFLTISELVAAAMRCSSPSNSPMDYLHWRLSLEGLSASLLSLAWSHEHGLTFGEFRTACAALQEHASLAIDLYNCQPVSLSSIARFLSRSPESGYLALELASHLSTADAMRASCALVTSANTVSDSTVSDSTVSYNMVSDSKVAS